MTRLWRFVGFTAALTLAACSASPSKTAPAATPAPGAVSPASPVAALPATALKSPRCSTTTASGKRLSAADVRLSAVPGDPFGVAVAADGRRSFVSWPLGRGGGGVGVFADTGAAVPKLVQSIPVAGPLGVVITHDGRYLLAASGSGAVVISVPQAGDGADKAIGTLSSPRGSGGGAIEVTVSPDDRFAFVSLEDSGKIAVFDLARALASEFRTSGFVGDIPVGIAPVGMAVSPDGRWLYATSELASPHTVSGGPLSGGQGTLSVISLSKAETGPAHAVVSTVTAGCSPVRVITSADGGVVWVTARESDRLMAFDAARLLSDPAHALVANVEVGEAPVGLALVDGGQRIVVADSNRFGMKGAESSLAVVNVAAALAGRPALAGYLPAGGFPRQMALEPDGRTLLVTDFMSGQLETVDVASLP